MTTEEYDRLGATTYDDAVEAMERMKIHLGSYPTTTEWNKKRDQLNIKTEASDVGSRTEYTFAQIREHIGGDDYTKPRRRNVERSDLPEGVSMNLVFERDVNYDPQADAYIYTLKLISNSDDVYYYVGKTKSLHGRLKTHKRKGGDSKEIKSVVGRTDDIAVIDVESYTKILEKSTEFRDRLSRMEKKKAFEIAKEYDTVNVLGGF